MKRDEFIEKCCRVVEIMNIYDYKFSFGSHSCEIEFRFEDREFHKIMDQIITFFPFQYNKLREYVVLCQFNYIIIRFLDK